MALCSLRDSPPSGMELLGTGSVPDRGTRAVKVALNILCLCTSASVRHYNSVSDITDKRL